MQKYQVKKGNKILTKKRGTVTDYITLDDLGSEELLKDLLKKGVILDAPLKKESVKKAAADEYKDKSGG